MPVLRPLKGLECVAKGLAPLVHGSAAAFEATSVGGLRPLRCAPHGVGMRRKRARPWVHGFHCSLDSEREGGGDIDPLLLCMCSCVHRWYLESTPA